jgi:hypothetical protein
MANNKDLKVVPIGGKHRSFSSMAGEAMEDKKAKRGMIFWFDEEGTMHFGEFGILRSDVGMILMEVVALSNEMMRQRDED